jgi:hypothetical protein
MIIYKTLYGIPEFKNNDSKVTFKLEKVFATMNKMALIKFKLNQPNSTIENEKIIIKVDYFDEMKAQDVSIVKEVALDWTNETDIEMIYDKQLKQVYSVAQINQCLKAIADLCDQKRFEDAKKNINQTLKAINKTTNEQYTDELLPLVESLKDYLEVLDYVLKHKK